MAMTASARPAAAIPFGARTVPMRSLFERSDVSTERVFYHNIWFKGHANPRYEALLPKLSRLDLLLATCSDRRIVRGVQFRALRWGRRLRHRAVFGLAARRYCFTFSSDVAQVPYIRGPVVVDVDDPTFQPDEVANLRRPNVRAYVVTAERAAERFRSLGVTTRCHVIPQGVDVSGVNAAGRDAALGRRYPGEVAVGYIAAWLLAGEDRGGQNPLYNTDHLFELWEQIHGANPQARLWLIGEPSDRVRSRCAGRTDILLLGRLPQPEALAHVATFDVGLYPRTVDQGIQAVKVAEYIGLGVPVVAYDLEVTSIVRQTGAGILAATPREFIEGVGRLARADAVRQSYAAAAAAAGRALDWKFLADKYEREILDVHLR